MPHFPVNWEQFIFFYGPWRHWGHCFLKLCHQTISSCSFSWKHQIFEKRLESRLRIIVFLEAVSISKFSFKYHGNNVVLHFLGTQKSKKAFCSASCDLKYKTVQVVRDNSEVWVDTLICKLGVSDLFCRLKASVRIVWKWLLTYIFNQCAQSRSNQVVFPNCFHKLKMACITRNSAGREI